MQLTDLILFLEEILKFNKISLTDNLADALNITEGSNSYLKFVNHHPSESIDISKNIRLVTDSTGIQFGASPTKSH